MTYAGYPRIPAIRYGPAPLRNVHNITNYRYLCVIVAIIILLLGLQLTSSMPFIQSPSVDVFRYHSLLRNVFVHAKSNLVIIGSEVSNFTAYLTTLMIRFTILYSLLCEKWQKYCDSGYYCLIPSWPDFWDFEKHFRLMMSWRPQIVLDI